jgi:hypothetical protein
MSEEVNSWIGPDAITQPYGQTSLERERERRRKEFDENVANLNPATERKRREDFDALHRRMQNDYSNFNKSSSTEVVVLKPFKFWTWNWRFW